MNLTTEAQKIYSQVIADSTKLGDLNKIAKEIKADHELAMELWSTGDYFPGLLATLILDKKLLSQDLINVMDKDMQIHTLEERNHIMEWLMANQLTKSKKTIAMIQSWENSPSSVQRRTFWYYQARLRWTGQTHPDNTPHVLSTIESRIAQEAPKVQWAMNFTAGWIGVYDKVYRKCCIKIGENSGLYKNEVAAKGCTPSYLPAFIEIEVNKRKDK